MMKSLKAPSNSSLRIRVFWGDILYRTAVFPKQKSITVGRDWNSTFIVDVDHGLPGKTWEMVKIHPDKSAELQFAPTVHGHIRTSKKVTSLRHLVETGTASRSPEGLFSVPLGPKDKAEIAVGFLSFYVDWVGTSEVIPLAKSLQKERVMFWGAIASILLFLSYFMNYWRPPETELPPERVVTLTPLKGQASVSRKSAVGSEGEANDQTPTRAAIGARKTADGGAQKGEIGKADLSRPTSPNPESQLKSEGLTSLFQGLSNLGTKSPERGGGGKGGSGIPAAIDQTGTGGFSTEGLGKGGGGQSVGIGRTVGQGEGGFEGTGRLGLAGNSKVEGGTGRGAKGMIVTEGGLDKDVIDSIVRRRQDRIRACYERQLNFSPGLAGKIGVLFTIGKLGEVRRAELIEDTMKNSSVHNCVLAEVKTWQFPPPKGGTLVTVEYPFVFESNGQR